jgi:DNA ligase-1
MKHFASLYRAIDETTKTNEKIAVLADYFSQVEPTCGAWAVFLLTGNKLSRLLGPKWLRQWASQQAGIPDWLFEETYGMVGDLAETIALLVDSRATETSGRLSDWIEQIRGVARQPEENRFDDLTRLWQQLGPEERFIFAKLMTGAWRVGVSRRLLTRAIAQAFHLPPSLIADRLMGKLDPTAEFFQQLTTTEETTENLTRPYPFCLAHPVAGEVSNLGGSEEFLCEWKWDGIRAQLIRRGGQTFIWSRGEERMEDRFPEVISACEKLPAEIVLDGELLGWQGNRPLGFVELQRRINRKQVGKKLLAEVPVKFVAFDLLELNRIDWRSRPLQERRQQLEQILDEPETAVDGLQISRAVSASNWSELDQYRNAARTRGAEGLMLKRRDSRYEAGRLNGCWWKWKIAPYSIDAVLIYAQRGHGRRASLYSDYTFALWQDENLVPIAKAYSGLTDAEIRQVDQFVRTHTLDKFGPVRSVAPELVMELAFENVDYSRRHKSGVAVRFPRILRWRTDKQPRQANSLEDLKQLIQVDTREIRE